MAFTEEDRKRLHEVHCAVYKRTNGSKGGILSRLTALEVKVWLVTAAALVALGAAVKALFSGGLATALRNAIHGTGVG